VISQIQVLLIVVLLVMTVKSGGWIAPLIAFIVFYRILPEEYTGRILYWQIIHMLFFFALVQKHFSSEVNQTAASLLIEAARGDQFRLMTSLLIGNMSKSENTIILLLIMFMIQ
jgi:hypothetical protein